jgi:hypothetical protein
MTKTLVLNFSRRPIVNLRKSFWHIELALPAIVEGVTEIKLPILGILEALDKGSSNVLLGNYVLVLPDNPLLSAGIVTAFMTLNKAFPIVAKTEEREEGLEIVGFINLGGLAKEVAVIREEIWGEYRKRFQPKTFLYRI